MPKYEVGDKVILTNGKAAVVTEYSTRRPRYPYGIALLPGGKRYRCGEAVIAEAVGHMEETEIREQLLGAATKLHTLNDLVRAVSALRAAGVPGGTKVAVASDEEGNGYNRLWSLEYDADHGVAIVNVADDRELNALYC